MRPRVVVALAVALVLGGCSFGGGGDEASGAALAAELLAGEDNACSRGELRCVDAVLDEMRARLDGMAAACDHLAPWLVSARAVMVEVRELVVADDLDDRPWTVALAAAFTNGWFHADAAWTQGEEAEVPEAWRLTFEAAEDRRVSAVGNTLMGMNAHISRDLPEALAAVAGADGDLAAHRADFDRVQALIDSTVEDVLEEIADRFDPTAAVVSVPGIAADTEALRAAIATWREEAWANGVELASATGDERDRLAERIDDVAAARAAAIALATRYPPFLGGADERDEFCASAR